MRENNRLILQVSIVIICLMNSSVFAQETIVLTPSSPNAVIEAGKNAVVFGTKEPNSITIKKGALVKIINNPGTNTITIEADSTEFKVSRSGAMVTLEAEDASDPSNPIKTVIKLPATKTNQIIKFNNGSLNLSIASGKVMLGEQEITLVSALIKEDSMDYILPTKTFEEIDFDSSEDDTGNIRFLKAEEGYAIAQPLPLPPSATVEEAARSFLSVYGSVFGVQEESSNLSILITTAAGNGRTFARFQQKHDQIPVLGAELIVQMDAGKNIMSVNGEILGNADTSKLSIRKINKNRKKVMRKITVRTTPGITADEAYAAAISKIMSLYDTMALTATTPELMIYNPILLGFSSPDKDMLVWRTEVNPSDSALFSELVLVDADSGEVVLHFNQIDSAKEIKTYNAQNSETLPVVECPPISAVPDSDCDNAADFASDTYDFYYREHGRDSIDNEGMKIISTVNYPVYLFWPGSNNPCNACWNGKQIFYGFGCTGGSIVNDDVVAHEITHGVTQYAHSKDGRNGLIYLNQSGAINESFSDIWGEFVDLTNGKGDDSAEVRWMHGEDQISGGERNLADPTIHRDPDKTSSDFYHCDSSDNGGVHSNSGIGNKAAFLITDGGTFNGYTIKGLGIEKTADLFYEVQTNILTKAANYADLYDALILACSNLKYSADDCQQVKNALKAVEMNEPRICGICRQISQKLIFALGTDSILYLKEGDLHAQWLKEKEDVKAISSYGNRIGILRNFGGFYVKELLKEGDTDNPCPQWVLESYSVKAADLSGNRIGVLNNDGKFYVKEGDLYAQWFLEMDSVKAIALSGNRIGALNTSGDFYVKEKFDLYLHIRWVLEMDSVKAIALSGNRIGALKNDGKFYVKEGDLYAQWVLEMDSVQAIALNGNRIGAITTSGNFYVKEGGLGAQWVLESDSVKAADLSGNRIGVLKNDGKFYVKEGDLYAQWVLEMDSVQAFLLSK